MDTRKGLAVLGSTGSVGVNTLDVVTSHPDKIRRAGAGGAFKR